MDSPPKRILVVDDDDRVRDILSKILIALGHEVETACDGWEALAKLELDIDLVLLDVLMPGLDGFQVAQHIRTRSHHQDLPIIMVTGQTSRQDRIRAVEVGVNDFVAKPFDHMEISVRTTSLLRMKDAHDYLKKHQLELEGIVQKRTEALRRALDNMVETQRRLHEAQLETIQRLVAAAEFKDQNTAAHIQRMSRLSAMLASKCGLSKSDTDLLLYASPMHDIGKIGTPEEILLKPGKLSADEWPLMKQHTLIGADILKDSSSELLQAGEVIALTHHERWDGSGYPKGLKGEDIPLWGRICAVTDVFDALTSERPYKPAYSNGTAIEIIKESAGCHFDPSLVECFIDNLTEVENIQKEINRSQPAAV